MTSPFRDDIQGLRAVAIMAVLTFHIGPRLFSGGFVGVDVFYVISGFLITNGIIARYEAGRWSLIEFYQPVDEIASHPRASTRTIRTVPAASSSTSAMMTRMSTSSVIKTMAGERRFRQRAVKKGS